MADLGHDAQAGAELLATLARVAQQGVRLTYVPKPPKQENLPRGCYQWQHLRIEAMQTGEHIGTMLLIHAPPSTVSIVLPDGRMAAHLRVARDDKPWEEFVGNAPDGRQLTCRRAHAFASIFSGKQAMTYTTNDGNGTLTIDSPSRPWVCPFLIFTACLGAFCMCCMDSELTWNIHKSGVVEKDASRQPPCGALYSRAPGCLGKKVYWINAQDPSIIADTILTLGKCLWEGNYINEGA